MITSELARGRESRSHRPIWAGTWLAVLLLACGGGSLTLGEYANRVEDAVADMGTRFETIDSEWEAQSPSAEGARSYWERRLTIRSDFLEDIRALVPPDEVAGMHARSLDLFERITTADEALAARVATYETVAEHWQWVGTPEGHAADAILGEVYSFCRESQDEFDATEDRESLEDVPWIPPEMKEVVRVAFGCPP